MILGDVEETITTIEIDDETYEEIVKVCCRCKHTHSCTCMLCVQDLCDELVLSACSAADKQEDGSLPVCQRRWCDFGITSTSVIMKLQMRLMHHTRPFHDVYESQQLIPELKCSAFSSVYDVSI